MTQKERAEAQAWRKEHLKKVEDGIEAVRRYDVYAGTDGWNAPPAVLPRPGELAMGVYFDPEKNTR